MNILRRAQSRLFPFLKPESPLYVVALAAAAVILIMVFVVFWATFKEGLPTTQNLFSEFSFQNYVKVFSYPLMPRAALNSVILAFGTTFVSMFFAVPMAWLIHRTTLPLKQLFVTLMLLHVVIPSFIRCMGWIMLISPETGILNQAIRTVLPFIETGPLNPYGLPFMVFLMGMVFTPTLFLMLGGAFMAIDPSLEESAEASGMNRLQVLFRISLPLLKPALLAGSMFVFVTAISMFEVPAMLGASHNIHVLSTLMYDAVRPTQGLPQLGIAGVYGVILLIPTLTALFYYTRMMKLSHKFRTITGKGYRPKLIDLGSWTWAGLAFIILYYITDMVFPLLGVIWTSLVPFIQLPSLEAVSTINLAGYVQGIEILLKQGAIGNTLKLMLFVGLSSVIIGLVMSWVSLRTKMPGRYAIDTIAMVPQVVPGIAFAFAMAFLGLLLVKVIPLYGTITSIIIADTVRRIPFATRTINSSLIQIHPELEEAVQTSGGSKVLALRKVIMPLIAPALLYTFIWSLLNAYREVTTALFLVSPQNKVLSTVIWSLWWDAGHTQTAAAVSVIMVGVAAIFILIMLKAFPQIRRGMRQH